MFDRLRSSKQRQAERLKQRCERDRILGEQMALMRATAHLPSVRQTAPGYASIISGTGKGAGEAFLAVLDEVNANIAQADQSERDYVRAEAYREIIIALIDRSFSGISVAVVDANPTQEDL